MSSDVYAQLQPILVNSYNPDRALRQQAEVDLSAFLKLSNSFNGFLGIVAETSIPQDVKMAAALVLKNNTRSYWQLVDAPLTMTEEEKSHAKEHLLRMLMAETCKPLRTLLAEILKAIVEHEFPDRWPALVPTIVVNLQSTDRLAVYNSLIVLRKLVKFFEYKDGDKRKPLFDIMVAVFPTIQGLVHSIINHIDIEIAMVFHQTLKILWSCTMYRLPGPETAAACDINFWFQFMSFLMEKKLPIPGEAGSELNPSFVQPASEDDRTQWPWWKAKKWASRIITHFITRYGNPKYCAVENQQFSEYFRSTTSVALLGPVMNCLASVTRREYITEEVHRQCLGFMTTAVEMAPTYKLIKAHLAFVMFDVVMPTLSLSEKDVELFTNDPVEFVRKVNNPMEDWLDPRVAAVNLLEALVRHRTKDSLGKLLAWVSEKLAVYDAEQDMSKKDYRTKDSIMVAMSTIATILIGHKTHKKMIQPFLISHVVPEFASPVGMLRSRACWMIEYFDKIDWDADASKGLLDGVMKGLLKGLRDKELPVQASAACSMRTIIEAEGAKNLLRPILPDIVQEYFRIMDEVENEAVLSALSAIVENFGEDIVPMAPMMVEKLAQSFLQFAAAGFEDDEAAFAATQCLDTMTSIVDTLDPDNGGNVVALRAVEKLMIPILIHTVGTPDCFEYLENGVQFMTQFTYYGDDISPEMWNLCGPLLQALDTWAYDYICEIMTPLLNYMSKDIDSFMQRSHDGVPLVQLLLKVVEKAFTNDDSDRELEAKCAANMLNCLVVTSKPSVQLMHGIWSPMFYLVMKRFTSENMCKTGGLKNKLLEVGLGMMYADVAHTIALFTSDEMHLSMAGVYFDHLFERLPVFEKPESQRLIVLAFSELLTAPLQLLPPSIQANINAVFLQVVREIALLKDAGEDEYLLDEEERGDGSDDYDMGGSDVEEDEEDEDFVGGDSEEEEDTKKRSSRKGIAGVLAAPSDGYAEDEDVKNAEDPEYLEYLRNCGDGGKKYMGGEPVDDEDDDAYEFTSPVDRLDVLSYFVEKMQGVAARDPAHVQKLRASLNTEDRSRVEEYMVIATQRANAPKEA